MLERKRSETLGSAEHNIPAILDKRRIETRSSILNTEFDIGHQVTKYLVRLQSKLEWAILIYN